MPLCSFDRTVSKEREKQQLYSYALLTLCITGNKGNTANWWPIDPYHTRFYDFEIARFVIVGYPVSFLVALFELQFTIVNFCRNFIMIKPNHHVPRQGTQTVPGVSNRRSTKFE